MPTPASGKSWRLYALRTFLFIALVAAADALTGAGFRYLYRHQRSGTEYPTRHSAEETRADLLVMGASRAMQQINPQFLEDTLRLSAWNAGRDGMPFFYTYGLLEMILQRYTPKVIVLDIEYKMLMEVPAHYDRLSTLLPFYRDHPEIRELIRLRGPFEPYKQVSAVYPYNSMLFKLLKGYLSAQDEVPSIKGYSPLFRSLNEPIKTWDYTAPYPLDSNKVRMLQAMIDRCRQRQIRLIFLSPPYYLKSVGTDYSFAYCKKMAADNNIPFIDYSTDTFFFNRPQLFDDTVHLNKKGSDLFSAQLAAELKKQLRP